MGERFLQRTTIDSFGAGGGLFPLEPTHEKLQCNTPVVLVGMWKLILSGVMQVFRVGLVDAQRMDRVGAAASLLANATEVRVRTSINIGQKGTPRPRRFFCSYRLTWNERMNESLFCRYRLTGKGREG